MAVSTLDTKKVKELVDTLNNSSDSRRAVLLGVVRNHFVPFSDISIQVVLTIWTD
jgi:BioD-like phosphotransacetylase family protein